MPLTGTQTTSAAQLPGDRIGLREIMQLEAPGLESQYANILTRRNRMLEDAVFEPTTEHVTDTYNAVKSIPQLAKTNIEQGAPVVRGAWETIREPTASWKAYSEVGDDVLAVADDPDKIRTDDANLVMQGASQQVASILVYGSRASMGLDGIDGFATRLNSISNQFGVFSGGGSGADLSSIYIIQWHKWYGACLLYPKNIPFAGIRARDMGMQEVTTPRGYYEVWHTKFEVHWGMEIREPRNVIRYCNLETAQGLNSFDLDQMIAILEEMQETEGAVAYMNRRIKTQLAIQAVNKPNVEYAPGEWAGRPVSFLQEVPVKLHEAVLSTESAVT